MSDDLDRSHDEIDRGLAAGFGRARPAVGSSVFRALERAGVNAPRISLPGGGLEDHVDSHSSDARYQIVGEVARGGMGIVFRSRDTDLGRDVAMKVLRDEQAERASSLNRFVEEAQVGGQLQHPGIAPVYEMGLRADRRPYFTMKLIKGETLSARLSRRSDLVADLGELLGIFEQVAQTVAYAHARGVVHRDLKPSNIMIGSYGEVLVVDWGLAKVLEHGGIADEMVSRMVETVRSDRPGSKSMTGSVMGTPAYMPPEQARGEVERVDLRSDVFALGALLCDILVGRPPYLGETDDEVQRKAAAADLGEVLELLGGDDVDEGLAAIARSCLQPRRNDRPPDAAAVARAVARHRTAEDERAREAQLRAIAEEAKVEEERKRRKLAEQLAEAERRRKKLTGVFAAAVVVALFVGCAGYYWIESARADRFTRRTAAVEAAIREANEHRGRARSETEAGVHLARGIAAARRALDLVARGDVDPEVGPRARALLQKLTDAEVAVRLAAELGTRERAATRHLDAVRAARTGMMSPAEVITSLMAAFREVDVDVESKSMSIDECVRRIGLTSIAPRLAAALDVWSRMAGVAAGTAARLRTIAIAVDPDPVRRALRAAPPSERRTRLRELARTADVSELPPETIDFVATSLRTLGDVELSLTFLRRAHRRYPDDFSINLELASRLGGHELGRFREAFPHAAAAVALREDHPVAHDALGNLLSDLGRHAEAEAAHRKAVALAPRYFLAHMNLGLSISRAGRYEEAERLMRKSIELKRDYALAHSNLGILLSKMGRQNESLAAHEAAVALKPDLAQPYLNYGAHLANKHGRLGEAAKQFEYVRRRWPENAHAYHNLGIVLRKKRKIEKAIEAHERARRLAPRDAAILGALARAYSDDTQHYDRAISVFRAALRVDGDRPALHRDLAVTLDKKGRKVEALRHYRRAAELAPDKAKFVLWLAEAYRDRGRYGEATRLITETTRRHPENYEAWNALGVLYSNHLGRHAEAIDAFRKALDCQPDDYDATFNIGIASFKLRKLEDAEEHLRRATEIEPKSAKAWQQLAVSMDWEGRKPAAALVAIEKALALDATDGRSWTCKGNSLWRTGRIEEAVAAYEKAIESTPGYAEPYGQLGLMHQQKRRMAEAIRWFKAGIEASPNSHLCHQQLGVTYGMMKQPEKALPCFLKAVELPAATPKSTYFLGFTYRLLGRPGEAVKPLRTFLRSRPNDWPGLEQLGLALGESRRWRPAVRVFSRMARMRPKDAASWFNLGKMFHGDNDFEKAAKAFGKAAALQPNNARAANSLGTALSDLGKTEDALAWHEKAHALAPDYPMYCHNIGLSLRKLGRLDEAIEWLQKTLALDADYPSTRWNLARAYQQKGQYEKAIEHFEDCISAALRAGKRTVALEQFRHALEACRERLRQANGKARRAVLGDLMRWKSCEEFAPVRDPALESLPPAERAAFRNVWTDVDAVIETASRRAK